MLNDEFWPKGGMYVFETSLIRRRIGPNQAHLTVVVGEFYFGVWP